MKKILLLVFTVSLISVTMAESYTYTDEAGYTWEYRPCRSVGVAPNWVEADLMLVSVSPFPVGRMVMPNSIRGYDVVEIADGAFNGLYQVTEIVFPNKLRWIRSSAFKGCTGLKNLIIPNTVTSISSDSFDYCTSLTNVVLSSGMSYIEGVFYKCTALQNITIPDSITKIYSAFNNCTSLKSVVTPDSVTSIGGSFRGCTALRYLVLGHAVTDVYYMDSSTFSGCTMLWNIVNYSPLELAKGSGIAAYAKNIYTEMPSEWGDLSPIYYTISFNANGGDGTMENLQVEFGKSQALPTCSYVRTGYKFAGWRNASQTASYSDGQNVVNLATDEDETVTLTAQWSANKYYVHFESNGGDGTMEDKTMNYGSSYSLYNYFTKTGYSFAGWATEPEGTVVYKSNTVVSNLSSQDGATITFYAIWVKDRTVIEFDAGEGIGYMSPQVIESGTTQNLASNEFRYVGHSFVGWSTYSYGNVDYIDGASYSSDRAESIKLHAVWQANRYTVKFDLQGATDTVQDRTFTYGEHNYIPYYYGRVKAGYEFKGWSFSPGGDVVIRNGGYDYDGVFDSLLVPDGGEVTLFAVWEGKEYRLIFSPNGGVGSMDSLRPRYDEEFALPSNRFIRAGHSFLGWATSYSYPNIAFEDGELVTTSNLVSSVSMSSIPLRAVWKNEIDIPSINIVGGSFVNASCEIAISCITDDTSIWYTVDGSDPSVYGKPYTAPFTIWKTTTIKASARRADGFWSEIATLTANRNEGLSEAVNLLGYTMESVGEAAWTVDGEVSHDGVSSVRSGAIGNGGTTTLTVSLRKAGTVSFWWRAQCEEAEEEDSETYWYDYGSFVVDGETVARIAGNDTGWRRVEHTIASGGKHVLQWKYNKDGATSYAPDCIWVDQVQWVPADGSGYTLTTPEPVPYAWLDQYNLVVGTDYETVGNAASGKSQGGKATKIWEEYVAGTDPTNKNSRLEAQITMKDGNPVITWEPDLNAGGGNVRIYKVYGSETLNNGGDWQYPTTSLHRFFKVDVEMP